MSIFLTRTALIVHLLSAICVTNLVYSDDLTEQVKVLDNRDKPAQRPTESRVFDKKKQEELRKRIEEKLRGEKEPAGFGNFNVKPVFDEREQNTPGNVGTTSNGTMNANGINGLNVKPLVSIDNTKQMPDVEKIETRAMAPARPIEIPRPVTPDLEKPNAADGHYKSVMIYDPNTGKELGRSELITPIERPKTLIRPEFPPKERIPLAEPESTVTEVKADPIPIDADMRFSNPQNSETTSVQRIELGVEVQPQSSEVFEQPQQQSSEVFEQPQQRSSEVFEQPQQRSSEVFEQPQQQSSEVFESEKSAVINMSNHVVEGHQSQSVETVEPSEAYERETKNRGRNNLERYHTNFRDHTKLDPNKPSWNSSGSGGIGKLKDTGPVPTKRKGDIDKDKLNRLAETTKGHNKRPDVRQKERMERKGPNHKSRPPHGEGRNRSPGGEDFGPGPRRHMGPPHGEGRNRSPGGEDFGPGPRRHMGPPPPPFGPGPRHHMGPPPPPNELEMTNKEKARHVANVVKGAVADGMHLVKDSSVNLTKKTIDNVKGIARRAKNRTAKENAMALAKTIKHGIEDGVRGAGRAIVKGTKSAAKNTKLLVEKTGGGLKSLFGKNKKPANESVFFYEVKTKYGSNKGMFNSEGHRRGRSGYGVPPPPHGGRPGHGFPPPPPHGGGFRWHPDHEPVSYRQLFNEKNMTLLEKLATSKAEEGRKHGPGPRIWKSPIHFKELDINNQHYVFKDMYDRIHGDRATEEDLDSYIRSFRSLMKSGDLRFSPMATYDGSTNPKKSLDARMYEENLSYKEKRILVGRALESITGKNPNGVFNRQHVMARNVCHVVEENGKRYFYDKDGNEVRQEDAEMRTHLRSVGLMNKRLLDIKDIADSFNGHRHIANSAATLGDMMRSGGHGIRRIFESRHGEMLEEKEVPVSDVNSLCRSRPNIAPLILESMNEKKVMVNKLPSHIAALFDGKETVSSSELGRELGHQMALLAEQEVLGYDMHPDVVDHIVSDMLNVVDIVAGDDKKITLNHSKYWDAMGHWHMTLDQIGMRRPDFDERMLRNEDKDKRRKLFAEYHRGHIRLIQSGSSSDAANREYINNLLKTHDATFIEGHRPYILINGKPPTNFKKVYEQIYKARANEFDMLNDERKRTGLPPLTSREFESLTSSVMCNAEKMQSDKVADLGTRPVGDPYESESNKLRNSSKFNHRHRLNSYKESPR